VITPRSVAVSGIGYGALAVATLGFLGGAAPAEQVDWCVHLSVYELTNTGLKVAMNEEVAITLSPTMDVSFDADEVASVGLSGDETMQTGLSLAEMASILLDVSEC
jgi:hypothetical protein